MVLVRIHSINIKGAAIGTMVAYCVAMILNARDVRKYTRVKINYLSTYIKPGFCAVIMGLVAFGVQKGIVHALSGHGEMIVNAVSVGIAIIFAIIIYLILIFVTKTINREDLQSMPGGRKLEKLYNKFNRKR